MSGSCPKFFAIGCAARGRTVWVRGALHTLVILLASGLTDLAAADESKQAGAANEGGVQEIIVTAQRRAENMQDVPISVSAITADSLHRQGVSGLDSLSTAVPGLTFATIGPSGVPFIRGIGSSAGNPDSEQSVALYVDGVYIASPNVNVFDFNYIDQVEVLKGPQGTLFGRNATGGVIQVQTRDPTATPSAEMSAGYGNYQTLQSSAYVTGGLTDTLSANLAWQIRNQAQGYGRNVFNGVEAYTTDNQSLRGKLLFAPSDLTRVLLEGDFARQHGSINPFKIPNGAVGRDGIAAQLGPFDTREDANENTSTFSRGVSLTASHDFGFGSLKSISAYRRATGINNSDPDTVSQPFFAANMHTYQANYSQEFHLSSAAGAPLKWLVGAYYFNTLAGFEPAHLSGIDLGGAEIDITGLTRTKSFSSFAQATMPLFADTDLTLGARYTDETQKFRTTTQLPDGLVIVPTAVASQSFNKPTWRVALDHKFERDVMGYVSYNRGVKSGGFTPLSAADSAAFKPEQLDAYETGLKTELFDRRLRLNASAYWYEYKNIQLQVIEGAATRTLNAAAARIKGLEAEFEAVPIADLGIRGGLTYAHGSYVKYLNAPSYGPGVGPTMLVDASGNETVRTPKLTGSLTLDYRFTMPGGALIPSATASYTGKFYWAGDNVASQQPYALINATLQWLADGNRYNVDFWVHNLTNKQYLSALLPSSYGDLTLHGAPRTYGIEFGFKL